MKKITTILLGALLALTFGLAHAYADENYAPVMGMAGSLSNGITYFENGPDCLGTGSAAGGISMAEPKPDLGNGITEFRSDVRLVIVKNSCWADTSLEARHPAVSNGITVIE